MPHITRLPDTLDQLLVEAGPHRTPGLHLSQIIRSILLKLEPQKYGGPLNSLYTDPGFTFERVLETAWASQLINIERPGEIERDGVICSPDGLDFTDPDEVVLVESKMTDMSMVGCPTDPKFRKWMWQIAAYCYVCEVRVARLHVLWLRGNYKEIRRAYTVDRIVWEQGELEQPWRMLLEHARREGMLPCTSV